MKRKHDFVTNSSSCSFIFIGWAVERKEETLKEIFNKYSKEKWNDELGEWENLHEVYDGDFDLTAGNGENGLNEDKVYLGVHKRISDDYEGEEYSIKDIMDSNKSLVEDGFKVEDVIIVTGSELC